MAADRTGTKLIAVNRKARHEYFVLETFEAGIELVGTEVKSLRMGGVNLKDSWCTVDDGELFVKGMHISPYEKGNLFNRDPLRDRKLLMHKREILMIGAKAQKDGVAVVPLKVYLKHAHIKLQIGLAKGKKLHDKRDSIAERDTKREMQRALRSNNRYD